MASWQFVSYLVPLLTYPYLTRVLGPIHYGEFSLCFAVAAFFNLITDWGFNLTATGAIARSRDNPPEISKIFWTTMYAKASLLTASFVILLSCTFIFKLFQPIRLELIAAFSLVVANACTLNWLLQGLERMASFAIGAIVGRFLTVPATFLLVHAEGDVWIANLVQGSGAMVGAFISMVLVTQVIVLSRPRLGIDDVIRHLYGSAAVFVSTLSANLYTTANVVIVGFVAGTPSVGIYSSADRLRSAAQSLINPISNAVYPRSNRVMHIDRERGLRFAGKLLLFQGAFTLLISLVLFTFADRIILGLAGERFQAAVPILRWMSWTPFLVGVSNVLGLQIMLPLGMNRQFSVILLSAGALNCGLVALLVTIVGPVGAAVATVMSEVFVTLAMALSLNIAKVPFWGALRSS